MLVGKVCKITIRTKNGDKDTTGVFLGTDGESQLWLLCFVHRADKEYEDTIMSVGEHGNKNVELGYTSISKGNTWFSDNVTVVKSYGQADADDLCRAFINIYSSPETWKLNKCHKESESTGINFWINYCKPKGATVSGGMFGKL